MMGAVLTLNAGSSSLKFSVFEPGESEPVWIAGGEVEGIGVEPHFTARSGAGAVTERRWPGRTDSNHEALLGEVLKWVDDHLGGSRLKAVGHRIVHGGPDFSAPVVIDAEVLGKLDALCPLAPLHQPHNLAGVRAAQAHLPGAVQVACFDTAFHHGHAPQVDRYALPRHWEELGVRRYGFHGLSYEYIARRMRILDPVLGAGRMIVAHLGAGASLCGVKGGRSIDTTMGFTALDGLVMATRCGSLDPGVILYLQQSYGLAAAEIEDMLYHRSGLLGVSGISGDMRVLLESHDERASEAIDLFVFRIVREIGAMTASMDGVDGLVFTAGVGEHSPDIRLRVCELLGWLGIKLDAELNQKGGGCISAPSSALPVWAVPTDEDWMIALHTVALELAPAHLIATAL